VSVQEDILDAAKAVLDNLNISGLTVLKRKRLTTFDPDSLPLCILSPGKPSIESEHTENTIVWVRPLWVLIATPTGDGILETNFGLLDLEEQIRQALYKPTLQGASSVFHSDMEEDDLYIPSANDTGYDLTLFRIDFWSQETRSV